MKIVYICHPVGGDVQGNLKKIRAIVRHINLTEPNVIPFVPYYADVVSMDDSNPKERARGIKNNLHLLKICDELWYFSEKITRGMGEEMKEALRLGKKIKSLSKVFTNWTD